MNFRGEDEGAFSDRFYHFDHMANVMKHHFNGDCHDSFDHEAGGSHDANHDEDFHTNVE